VSFLPSARSESFTVTLSFSWPVVLRVHMKLVMIMELE
jgi:hypothetical protein